MVNRFRNNHIRYATLLAFCILNSEYIIFSMTTTSQVSKKVVPNREEFEKILLKYRKGIDIVGVPEIKLCKLTGRSLEHVFGVEVSKKKELSGFHHDQNLTLEQQEQPFHLIATREGPISEGIVAFKKEDTPTYKTFFSHALSREQVVDQMVTSLRNVKTTEIQKHPKGDRIVITGEAGNDFTIKTVIGLQSREIITFFPVVDESFISNSLDREKALFKKFFHVDKAKTMRNSITASQAKSLASQFNAIPFNKCVCAVDVVPRLVYQGEPAMFIDALIDQSTLPGLMKKYPGRVRIKHTIPTLHITQEVIEEMLSD